MSSNLPTNETLQEFGKESARFLAEDAVRRTTLTASEFRRFERLYKQPPMVKDILTGEMVPDYPKKGTKAGAELWQLSMDFMGLIDPFKEFDIVDDMSGQVIVTMPALFIQPITMTSEVADQAARENYNLCVRSGPSHHADAAFAKLNAMYIQTQIEHLPDLMKSREAQVAIHKAAEATLSGVQKSAATPPEYRPDGDTAPEAGSSKDAPTAARPVNAEWDLDD